jgi:pyrroline-5-carboxylate reductase
MKIAIFGAGVMGRALAAGLQDRMDGVELCFGTRTPESAVCVSAETGLAASADPAEVVRDAVVVVLCLKPQKVLGVLDAIGAAMPGGAVVVSIAAGMSLTKLALGLPEGQALVRAMPNTPCRIGAGMTVLSAGAMVAAEQMQRVEEVFSAFGDVLCLDEEHMDAVTGLSASGPAFLFLVIEALTDGGVMAGLPRDVALKLATQATKGAACLVEESGEHPAQLRDAVTTPAGCTISALLRLEDGKLRSVLARGVQEAAESAASLGAD